MQKADPKAGLVFVVSGDEVRSNCKLQESEELK